MCSSDLGVWNDHVAVQAALAAVHYLRLVIERLQAQIAELTRERDEFGTLYGLMKLAKEKVEARVAELEKQLDAARANVSRRAEVEFKQAQSREQMLEAAVGQTKKEFDDLNARSFEYQTLKREADGDKQLYEELVRRIKEAGIKSE